MEVSASIELKLSRGLCLTQIAIVVVLQLLMLQPSVVRQDTDPPSLKALVTDPYIIVAAGRYNSS